MPENHHNAIVLTELARRDSDGVFHVSRRRRNLAIVSRVAIVLLGSVSAFGMWFGAPEERRLAAVIFVATFWTCWAGLVAWLVLAGCRQCLTIRDGKVIRQGVLRRQRIDLADVTDVRWNTGASITLRTRTERLRICLHDFESAEGLWLIRRFRHGRPASDQHGWDLFCFKVAIPLRDSDAHLRLPLRPDQAPITRRRWDCVLAPLVAISALIAAVFHARFQQPATWGIPLLMLALWQLIRRATPKQGLAHKRMDDDPDSRRLWILSCWCGVAIVAIVSFDRVVPPGPRRELVAVIAGVLWLGGFARKVWLLDREMKQHDLEAAKSSVQKWIEQDCISGPTESPR